MDHNIITGINEAYVSIQEAYTVQGKARIGSTAAKATDSSVSSAVDKALANKGTAVSASSEKGKTGVTGSGSFRMSGSIGGGKSKPKPNPAPTGGSRPKPQPTPAAKPTSPAPRVQNPAASPARRVQNPAASTPTRRPGGGMSISRGGGGRGMMRMDTMSDVDTYNLVLEYLLDEGFASTEQSADKIILNMSEAWFADIMELTGGKGHPGYKAGSKDHGDLEDHPAVKKGGVLSPRYGNHLGDMDDEDEDEDDLESVVKQQSRDSRERTRKPLRDKVKAARKKMTKEEVEQVDEDSRRMSNKQHTKRVRSNIKSFGSNYTPPNNYDPDANRGQGEVLTRKQMEKKRRKSLRQEGVESVDEARNPEVEERGKKVGEYERSGKYQGITSKFRKEYPGSREAKKERGRKPTEGEVEQERIKTRNARVAKYGFTKKEKKESKAREKYDSPRD